MRFLKEGDVRIEQLRDELYSVLGAFPSQAIQWNGKDAVEIEDVGGKATGNKLALQEIIDAHVHNMEYFADEKPPSPSKLDKLITTLEANSTITKEQADEIKVSG